MYMGEDRMHICSYQFEWLKTKSRSTSNYHTSMGIRTKLITIRPTNYRKINMENYIRSKSYLYSMVQNNDKIPPGLIMRPQSLEWIEPKSQNQWVKS